MKKQLNIKLNCNSESIEFKVISKRSNLKSFIHHKGFFDHPEKFLKLKPCNYSPEYVRRLKYIVKKYKKYVDK